MNYQVIREGGLKFEDITLVKWDVYIFDTEQEANDFMKTNENKFVFDSTFPFVTGRSKTSWYIYARPKDEQKHVL